MRISETTLATTTSRADQKKRKKISDNSPFSELLSGVDAATEVAAVSDVAPIASVESMLAIQEVSDDELTRRKAVREGFDALEALEEWRHALLMGSLSESQIRHIHQTVHAQKSRCTDPELQAVLDDIELRTAVELAKLEMSFTRRFA